MLLRMSIPEFHTRLSMAAQHGSILSSFPRIDPDLAGWSKAMASNNPLQAQWKDRGGGDLTCGSSASSHPQVLRLMG
jgi:hypothetical protein